MFPKIMKWASLAALLLAIAFRRLVPEYLIVPQLVIFIGASVVLLQGIHERKYAWATAFAVIAVVFNPILILVPNAGVQFFVMVSACFATFALALATLKTPPLLSIPSITDRTPGSESL